MTLNNSTLTVGRTSDQRTRVALLTVGMLVFSAFVYGSGMEAEIRKARAVNEQRKVVAEQLHEAQRTLRVRIAAVEQLEARRQVALALDDLDQRNFGTAQTAVAQASSLLDKADVQQTTNPDLAEIARALKATSLVATTDIGVQREALRALAARMDVAFGTYTAPFIASSAADDLAHPIPRSNMNEVPAPPGGDHGSDLTTGQDYKK